MKTTLVFSLLCLPFLILAQFSAPQLLIDCETCDIANVLSEDFDGDGDNDVLSASTEDDKVVWYQNDGTGKFSPQIIITSGEFEIVDAEVADMDNDGDMDVVALSERAVIFYANDGNGNFAASEVLIVADTLQHDLFLEDLNGDGLLDILTITDYQSVSLFPGLPNLDKELYWYQQSENLIFLTKQFISSSISPIEFFPVSEILFIDFDNDNDLDILLNKLIVGASWLENDGEANFEEKRLSEIGFEGRVMGANDFDNDGNVDLLSYNLDSEELGIYIRKNSKEVIKGQVLVKSKTLKQVLLLDLSGDNFIDIVVKGIGELYVFANNSDETFDELFPNGSTSSVANFTLFDIKDFNGDKEKDLLFAFPFNNQIEWQEIPVGSYTASSSTIITRFGQQKIYLADFDGDRNKDLLVGTFGNSEIVWYQNLGNNVFNKLEPIDDFSELRWSGFFPIDLNNDNCTDIFVHYSNAFKPSEIYKKSNNGEFYKDELFITPWAREFLSTDFNNDSINDISVFTSQNTLVQYINNGDGEFIDTIIHEFEKRGTIFIDDFDNDGLSDIINHNSEGLFWIRNINGNSFDIPVLLFPLPYYFGLQLQFEDFDKDGDKDILLLSSIRERGLRALVNNGDNVFDLETIIENDLIPKFAYFFDIDGDNDLDVVMTGKNDNSVYFSLNDGFGNFFNSTRITNLETYGIDNFENSSHQLLVGDLDSNNYKDLVLSLKNGKVILFENQTNSLQIISGKTYWDKNENQQLDSNEIILQNIPVQLNQSDNTTFSDQTGNFNFFISDGNYKLSAKADDCWGATTDSILNLSIEGVSLAKNDFGFQLISDIQSAQPRINSSATRCGFEVNFTISVENDGCALIDGLYGVVLDDLVTYKSALVEPTEIREDTLLWTYEALFSTKIDQVQLTLEIAGADFIGEKIKLTGLAYITDNQGQLNLSNTYDFFSEIRCAYDPNDKLVHPNRLDKYDQNYTLFEENLEYTIRFQNTGNDTAFNIIIRDQLDKNLDWTTFKPIMASHPFETLLHKNGLVEFSFKNILLPDSIINEPLSHGYITYSIATNKNLAENTIIENTASIYFDFNPPIITNTIANELVSELPKTTSTVEFVQALDIKAMPNPFLDNVHFSITGLHRFNKPIFYLFDLSGKLLEERSLANNETMNFEVTNLNAGIYFYQVVDISTRKILGYGKLIATE